MSLMYADTAFAVLDADLHLERVAGGNETEVYCTDDRRFVVKVKGEAEAAADEALAQARTLRTAAGAFASAVGPEHSIPNYHIITRNSEGQVQLLVVQPYFRQARPLFEVDYAALEPAERKRLGQQLRQIMRRCLTFYRQTGRMPDIYGRTSRSKAERRRLNAPHRLPWRLWSFLVKRTLLRSHNLLLTEGPEQRVILVDYDPIRQGRLYQFIYYNVRRLLFLRDYLLILVMEKSGFAPKA